LITHGNFDAIVSYSVPTTGWQAVAFAKRARVPFVFRAIDISHSLRKTNFAPLIQRAERYVYRNADHLSANNPALAEYCLAAGASQDRLSIDLPPLDSDHFSPAPADPALRERLGLRETTRVILFMGTLFRFAGLDDVMKTLRPALRSRTDLRLVILGDGEHGSYLRDLCRRLELTERVVFTGRIEYEDLPRYLRLATVAINPFEHSLTTDCALPHKVLQYLSTGAPTVSTDLRGLMGVLGADSGCSFEGSPSLVAGEALRLVDDPLQLAEMARRGRGFAVSRLSTQAAARAFEKMIASAVDARR